MGGRDDEGLYDFAGKGAKRQKRLSIQNIPREIRTARSPRSKIVRERLDPHEHRAISGHELKRKIRVLALKGRSPREIDDVMKQQDIRVSLITISGVRAQMWEMIKFLREKGLINEGRLERYRAR